MTAMVESLPTAHPFDSDLSTAFAPGVIGKDIGFKESINLSQQDDFGGTEMRPPSTKDEVNPLCQPDIGHRAISEAAETVPDTTTSLPILRWWREASESVKDVPSSHASVPYGSKSYPPENKELTATAEISDDLGRMSFNVEDDKSLGNVDSDVISSEDAEETADSYFLEQKWFHENVRFILRRLLQQWGHFRTQTGNHSDRHSDNVDQGNSPTSDEAFKDSNKRKREAQAENRKVRKKSPVASKCTKRSEEGITQLPLACPYCKKNLQENRECAKFGFKRAGHVKQHINRNHNLGLSEATRESLKKRFSGSEENKWYRIFDILFPGYSPRPISPYNDFVISEQSPIVRAAVDNALHIPYEYLMTEGAGILLQQINSNPAFSRQGGPDIADVRYALGQLFGDYLNQQLAPSGTQNQQTQSRSRTSSLNVSGDGDSQDIELSGNQDILEQSENHIRGHQNQFSRPDHASSSTSFAYQGFEQLLEGSHDHHNSEHQFITDRSQHSDSVPTDNQEEEVLGSELEESEWALPSDLLFDSVFEYPEDGLFCQESLDPVF
ncbi:hypothetical protein IL306_000481 [Fusarium sp. DS 682]|nr:hypothetical protein IL306_000481 [Fusarium sp. DS 682]